MKLWTGSNQAHMLVCTPMEGHLCPRASHDAVYLPSFSCLVLGSPSYSTSPCGFVQVFCGEFGDEAVDWVRPNTHACLHAHERTSVSARLTRRCLFAFVFVLGVGVAVLFYESMQVCAGGCVC